MRQVEVTLPATTANLGPGFDCLGLALGLYNRVTLTAVFAPEVPSAELAAGARLVTISGEGAGTLPTDAGNLVARAAEAVFQKAGIRPAKLRITQHNDIPVGSGLGSSAAATLGGILAANALVGGRLTDEELLWLATEMECHPDNVVPAFYGGLTLAVVDDGRLHVERIHMRPMEVVIVLPEFELATAAARAALPEFVPLADAVFNLGRVGLVMCALERSDFGRLSLAMQDRLHQPYRLPLIPGMEEAFTAARDAGAAAVALSGAGPSVIAFTEHDHAAIASAISRAFAQAGLAARSWILPIDDRGCRVDERPAATQ